MLLLILLLAFDLRVENGDHKGPKQYDRNSDKWLLLSVPKCLGSAAQGPPDPIFASAVKSVHIYECFINDFIFEFKKLSLFMDVSSKKNPSSIAPKLLLQFSNKTLQPNKEKKKWKCITL